MAELTTAQKARIIVTDEYGEAAAYEEATFSDAAVARIEGWPANQNLVALAPGTGTLTVTKGASVGTLDVTVTAAPLTVALGDPVRA